MVRLQEVWVMELSEPLGIPEETGMKPQVHCMHCTLYFHELKMGQIGFGSIYWDQL